MNVKNQNLKHLVPHVSNQGLLYCASALWAFAGIMLMTRGFTGMAEIKEHLIFKLIFSIVFGTLFFLFLFSKISSKHISRIKSMEETKVPFYAFFNLRSYILMTLMISMGITVRKTGIVPLEYLSVFYVIMGLPLFLSSVRFFYHALMFKKQRTSQH